jgi:anti-sigma factor RsiW
MSGPPTHPSDSEIEELLGAYALDALEPEERALVEEHLRTCVRCSAEVAHHHEVAGLLANSGGDAPDQLWDKIAQRLGSPPTSSWDRLAARLSSPDLAAGGLARPADPIAVARAADPGLGDPSQPDAAPVEPAAAVVPITAGRRRGRVLTVVVSVVAAAAVVAAIALGVQVHHLNRQVSALNIPHQTVSQAAQVALASPTSQRVHLTPTPTSPAPKGAMVTLVLSKSGTGYLIPRGLSRLPTQETYQLWGSIGGQLISLGVLGPHPPVSVFSFDAGVKVQAFAITVEPAGGVGQTTHQPVVRGSVTA